MTPDLLEALRVTGPFAVAVVALGIAFWAEYRERRRRPALRLLFDPASEDIEADVDEGPGQKYWVRLRVANLGGKHTAEDVEVLIVRVRPWHVRMLLTGFRLPWANTVETDRRWSNLAPWPARQTIPPGIERHVDLLYIARSDPECDPSVVPSQASIVLQALPKRRDDLRVLGEGTWCVLVAVAARDVDAVYYRINLDFDGLWWGEEIREHLKLLLTKVQYVVPDPERARKWRLARRSRTEV